MAQPRCIRLGRRSNDRACYTGTLGVQNDSPANCQFGNSGRNSVRGPHFIDSDMYITKTFPIREGIKLRIDGQLFNAFNHPNFALPSTVQAGVPGSPISRFGTLQSTASPPTGLLGVGLGGDTFAAHDRVSGKNRILKLPPDRCLFRPSTNHETIPKSHNFLTLS